MLSSNQVSNKCIFPQEAQLFSSSLFAFFESENKMNIAQVLPLTKEVFRIVFWRKEVVKTMDIVMKMIEPI